MDDDDYVGVLREELAGLLRELEELRAYREKRRKLVQVLKEERKALEAQKEERLKRSQVLLRIDDLQEMYEMKKEDRHATYNELCVAIKSYNRLLIATGRQPIDEPVQLGGQKPKIDNHKSHKGGDATLTMLPLLSPTVTPKPLSHQLRLSKVLSHKAPDLVANQSNHSARSSKSGLSSKGSKAVVHGILKKTDTPRANPKKSVVAKKKAPQQSTQATSNTNPVEQQSQEILGKGPKQPIRAPKVDGRGDMTDFLDSIGYYSPREGSTGSTT